jgi:membrane protease YdiL (CAAX protease family)
VIERGLIMDNQIKVKNYTKSYVIWTYAVFWIGILIAAGLYLLSNSELVMSLSTIPLSWIPTIVLFVMFNKLISNASRKEWLKENFKTKVNIKLVLITTLIFVLSIVLTYLIMICYNDAVLSLKEATVSFGGVVIEIIVCIITGATGEELGWRGYLQRHFEEKENGDVLKSALKVGLVWCFWHTLLWFVSGTGFGTWYLISYIATFIILNMCLSLIIAICYKKCRNIFVPMWIHFLSNVTMSLAAPYFSTSSAIIEAKWILSALYIVVTLLFVLWYKRKEKDIEQQKI